MNSIGIVDILKLRGFDPTVATKLVRHKDDRYDMDALIRNGWFEYYQATQSRPVFDRCKRIVSFVGTSRTKARLLGVYRVVGRRDSTEVCWPEGFPESDAEKGKYFYDLVKETGYEDLENRVVIEWGKGALAWVQSLSNKEVVELLPKGQLRPLFKDYLEFTLAYAELVDLFKHEESNREWRARLEAVAGVYLILETKTGMQYIGSAYGTGGIWGRWRTYALDGHGGNKLLKELLKKDKANYPQTFVYSILQILPKSNAMAEVLKWEKHYKEKLGSRAIGLGLNAN